jgi:hypothetical protein
MRFMKKLMAVLVLAAGAALADVHVFNPDQDVQNADHADVAGYATNAGVAGFATNANWSLDGKHATNADYASVALYATNAGVAGFATNADWSLDGKHATNADYASVAGTASGLTASATGVLDTAYLRQDGTTTMDGDLLFSQSNRFSFASQDNPATNIWLGTNSLHYVLPDGTVVDQHPADVQNARTAYGWGDKTATIAEMQSRDNALETQNTRTMDDYLNLVWTLLAGETIADVPMKDGYVDAFIDETGVNTGEGSNFTYTAGDSSYDWSYTPGAALTEVPVKVWFKFEDDAGNATVANSGTASAGDGAASINSSAFTAPGKITKGFNFDGRGSVAVTGWKGITGGDPRTITGWILVTNETGAGWDVVLDFGLNQAGFNAMYLSVSPMGAYTLGKRALNCAFGSDGMVDTTFDVADSAWHFFVMAVSNDFQSARIDMGTPVTKTYTINTIANQDFCIGIFENSGAKQPFGCLDDLRVFDRYISTQEMWAIYNSGNGTQSSVGPSSGGNMALYGTNPPSLNFVATNARAVAWVQGATNVGVSLSGDRGATWTAYPFDSIEAVSPLTNVLYTVTNALAVPSSSLWWKVTSFGNTTGSLHGISVQGR